MNYSLNNVKEVIQNNHFYFKKSFGQNFIIDENIIRQIVQKSNIDRDILVIEIGPGAGSLTRKLSEVAGQVLCYEIDSSLKPVLNHFLQNKKNIEILYQDFLKSDIKQDIKKYSYSKIYVVANLPYYITTPIIMKLIEDQLPIDKIVVMVQKEVGDRFRAVVGTKEYNSLSVFLNYYFDVKKLLNVSKNVFFPKPKVDSMVIEFSRKKKLLEVKNKTLFFQLIRDSFKQKRKTLKNNLREYDIEKIDKVLQKYQLDTSARAEKLSVDIFIDIANHLDK